MTLAEQSSNPRFAFLKRTDGGLPDSVIVVILLIVAADNGRAPLRAPVLAPFCLSLALALTMLLYYGSHALLFGMSIV